MFFKDNNKFAWLCLIKFEYSSTEHKASTGAFLVKGAIANKVDKSCCHFDSNQKGYSH